MTSEVRVFRDTIVPMTRNEMREAHRNHCVVLAVKASSAGFIDSAGHLGVDDGRNWTSLFQYGFVAVCLEDGTIVVIDDLDKERKSDAEAVEIAREAVVAPVN
jgi:hypothetical protein